MEILQIYATGLILNLRKEGTSSHFLARFLCSSAVINSLTGEISHDVNRGDGAICLH